MDQSSDSNVLVLVPVHSEGSERYPGRLGSRWLGASARHCCNVSRYQQSVLDTWTDSELAITFIDNSLRSKHILRSELLLPFFIY